VNSTGRSMSRSRSEGDFRISRFLRGVLVLFLLSSAVSCSDPDWKPLLPEGRADLTVVLEAGISQQEVNHFLSQSLQIEASDGGEWLRPGVHGILNVSVANHEAYAVVFDHTATPDEREAIREAVKSSPYVYRVFENVAPEDIRLEDEFQPSKAEAGGDHGGASPGE